MMPTKPGDMTHFHHFFQQSDLEDQGLTFTSRVRTGHQFQEPIQGDPARFQSKMASGFVYRNRIGDGSVRVPFEIAIRGVEKHESWSQLF